MDSAPPAAAPAELEPPARAARGAILAGRYRIVALLGKGRSSEIYRATQIDHDREVALKLFTDRVEEGARERFVREAKTTAGIRHPCIADVYDVGITDDGTRYCAMELLVGETLGARLARDGRLDHAEAIPLAASACSALQTVHGKGFLHRDVKPSNIFLAVRADGGQDVKLLDFGIARHVDGPPARTGAPLLTLPGLGQPAHLLVVGAEVSTLEYSSPDQACCSALDARSDVYALGATLYQMLTGSVPFAAPTASALVALIRAGNPQRIAARCAEAGVPEAIDHAVLRALAKAPEDRYPTAADFATALWSAAAGARDTASFPALEPHPTPRARRLGIVAAVALPLAILGLVLLMRAPDPAPAPPTSDLSAASVVAPAPPAPPEVMPAPSALAPRLAEPTPTSRPRSAGARLATSASVAAPPVATPSNFRIDDLKTPFH